MMRPTRQKLLKILRYEPETGLFYWRIRLSNRVMIGNVAGYLNGQGYREIQIDGRIYQAHRIAWLFISGRWPQQEVDHVNGKHDDNRAVNLRSATKSQNQHNRKKTTKSTSSVFKGCCFHKVSGKWGASIQHENKRVHLGLYFTELDAHEAYKKAALKLHGEFARV